MHPAGPGLGCHLTFTPEKLEREGPPTTCHRVLVFSFSCPEQQEVKPHSAPAFLTLLPGRKCHDAGSLCQLHAGADIDLETSQVRAPLLALFLDANAQQD